MKEFEPVCGRLEPTMLHYLTDCVLGYKTFLYREYRAYVPGVGFVLVEATVKPHGYGARNALVVGRDYLNAVGPLLNAGWGYDEALSLYGEMDGFDQVKFGDLVLMRQFLGSPPTACWISDWDAYRRAIGDLADDELRKALTDLRLGEGDGWGLRSLDLLLCQFRP